MLEPILQYFYSYLASYPSMLHAMLQNTLHHKVSLGFFGQLIQERYGDDAGTVDIKYGAYIPTINGIRLLALKAGIQHTSTYGRIVGLKYAGNKHADEWLTTWGSILKFRSLTPWEFRDGQYESNGKIQVKAMGKELQNEYKEILKSANRLQKYVKQDISEFAAGG